MNRKGPVLRFGFYGLLMGFCLSRMGFSSFPEVHAMFTFSSLRLFLTFAGGVMLIAMAFIGLRHLKHAPTRPFHKGAIIGGVIFGAGWALTGACPSIALVQVGEGQIAALFTIVGLVLGNIIYPRVHRRLFNWNMGSCNM